jgi:UDP:flavonoid glycosyltransferase YjiC (YdhE family)
MDEALDRMESVVYINMGSMFIWTEEEYNNCIQALEAVYHAMQGRVRFIIKINKPRLASRAINLTKELPPFIMQTHWIESQQAVYRHQALRVVVHHGGGNMFNEAVYFGVPQLVLSQWLDTHELAQLATRFGFGLQSSKPPTIEKEDVQNKLLRLLGSDWTQFKSNAMAWSTRSKLGGGAVAAAKVILAQAESQRLTRAYDQKRG